MTAEPAEPRRPGAWPAGCQRPRPLPAAPEGAWDAAVAEYRAMNETERRARGACECGCTANTRHHA